MWYIVSPVLQPGLHRGDQTETGDKTEGTPRFLREEDDDVGCMCGRTPTPSTGRRPHSAGPWQRTGTVGEGGPTHPDDTLRGALKLRWRTENPGCWTTVMSRQEGRSNSHQPLTSNDTYPQ